MEGLVAGLGRTTVVFTGDTESVVENLQLRQQKQKRKGGGKKGEKRAREKKSENEPKEEGWGEKNEHHKYCQGQHITITTAATVSSSFWCSLAWFHNVAYPLSTCKYKWDQGSKNVQLWAVFCTQSLRANSGRGYGAFAKYTTVRPASGLQEQLIQTEFESFVVSVEAGFVYWEETEISIFFFPKMKRRKRLAF